MKTIIKDLINSFTMVIVTIKEALKNWNNSFCSHLYDELHNYILNLKEIKK